MNFITVIEILFFTLTILLLLIHQVIYKKFRKKCHMGGKTVLITGGSTGIGAGICIELIKKGARVIITGRNSENVKETIKTLLDDLSFYNYIQGELNKNETDLRIRALRNGKWIDNGKNYYSEFLHYRNIDQLDFESCREFTKWVNKNFKNVDILINNAGAAFDQKKYSKQDIEATMAINHFSHVLITNDLLPLLKTSEEPRIINTSSEAHNLKVFKELKISLDDIFGEKIKYKGFPFYCRSKLANVLFTNTLQKHLSKNKMNISAFSFHPGTVSTEITRDLNLFMKALNSIFKLFLRTVYEGCQTGIYLCCEDINELKLGGYYDNNSLGKMNNDARDEDYCGKFWNKTLDVIEEKIGGKLENFSRV